MVIKHVERRVRLSDSHIKKLRQKDKLFSVTYIKEKLPPIQEPDSTLIMM